MLINENLFIEVDSCQRVAVGNRLCGAVYLQRRVEDCILSILVCSGNNDSVKGNLFATMLSSMAIKHFEKYRDIVKVVEAIISVIVIDTTNITPLSFTIVKVDNESKVNIVSYGMPEPICLRGDENIIPTPNCVNFITTFGKLAQYNIYKFEAKTDDRIVFFNNLIEESQSGDIDINNSELLRGVSSIICKIVREDDIISANELSNKIILDSYNYKDGHKIIGDQCCAVVYFRKPRKILLCSGPAYDREKDKILAEKVRTYNGAVIISGGTTAGIISRELNREISVKLGRDPSGLPNESSMEGIEMVTEGVLTLGRVKSILNSISEPVVKGRGIDVKLTRQLLNHDVIDIIVGTRINAMHQDPNIPVELELRRNVLKDIAKILREKFFKEVNLTYF